MNPLVLRAVVSFRKEIALSLGVIALLVLLPLIAVIEMVNGGVASASSALVKVDPITHLITIYNPTGKVVRTIQATTIWPVGGVVTQEFGTSNLPYQVTHTGIDIADPHGKIGRLITTFMDGVVSKVMNTDNEYGRYVFVDHENNVQSQYWHLSQALVTVGQHVTPGDVIGLEGETGYATGPHLHFQINVYGVPVNPRLFEVGSPPSGLDTPIIIAGIGN